MKAGILGFLLLACAQETTPRTPATPPAPSYPPGTALLVEGLTLTADAPERLCADILALYPEYSRVHALRLALTNEFLPRLAVRASHAQAWEQARADCQAAGDRPEGLASHVEEGNFRTLGVGLWSEARHLPLGAWSDPIEQAGRWLRILPLERAESADPREEVLTLRVVEFPLLPSETRQAEIEAAIDAARLTLVDPHFEEAVPEAWKHRMRGTKP